jgi:hypothetical protein
MKIGYTRDHDHPDEDTRGDPTNGQMARFFYDYRPVHDAAGVAVLDADGKPKNRPQWRMRTSGLEGSMRSLYNHVEVMRP